MPVTVSDPGQTFSTKFQPYEILGAQGHVEAVAAMLAGPMDTGNHETSPASLPRVGRGGASHRLDREFGQRFGDKAYAFEELVAELGAAFLCSMLGIANEPRPDHAAYVASWLEVLGKDSQAIFTAANRAQLAVEYLAHFAYEAGVIQ